ncbi:MAG: hypothetical protein RR989_03205, partial [Ruthenibacterium sp.]
MVYRRIGGGRKIEVKNLFFGGEIMLKKGIALFMAICMMSTCVPMAFAEEPLAPALAESTSVAAESAAPQSVPTSTPAASASIAASQSVPTSTPAASASISAPQSESA